MSGYDIGGGYDAWKTATPWDNDKEITLYFECECGVENEVEAVVSGRSGTADVECAECGKTNSVDYGDDE
jgi:transcription elongation factor Elf1